MQHGRTHTAGLEGIDQCLGFIGLAVVGADDIDALGREVQGGVLAQAAAGTGDQSEFAGHGVVLVVEPVAEVERSLLV
ncbi:hypothetical protein D3C76_1151540 [compost metagenome]